MRVKKKKKNVCKEPVLPDSRLSVNLSSLPFAITFLKQTPEREESEGEEGANDFPNVSYLSKSQMVL